MTASLDDCVKPQTFRPSRAPHCTHPIDMYLVPPHPLEVFQKGLKEPLEDRALPSLRYQSVKLFEALQFFFEMGSLDFSGCVRSATVFGGPEALL